MASNTEDRMETVGPITIKPRTAAGGGGSGDSGRAVAVLNCGGTIGMKAGAHGALAPVPGYFASRLASLSELTRPEMPALSLYELLPLLDSSDMGPSDWIRIASTIEELYYEYDGFVVVMGTDTMAYAASALSFICEGLGKTVILTGAMLPLVDIFNDGQRNLIVSIVLAASLDMPEVGIFIDDKLMRGNRTVKVNSSGLDAFDSPNFPPLAQLEIGIRYRPTLCMPQPRGRFRVHKSLCTAVAVWRMVPGFDDEYVISSIRHAGSLRAIVLELYGTGNMSSRKASLIDALTLAVSKGIIIVVASQCMRGAVNLSAYALGKKLEAIGVIPAYDMTTEAICCKLAYILSWPGVTTDDVRHWMAKSLRGEMTEELAQSDALLPSSLAHTTHGFKGAGGGEVKLTMETLQGASRMAEPPSVVARAASAPRTTAVGSAAAAMSANDAVPILSPVASRSVGAGAGTSVISAASPCPIGGRYGSEPAPGCITFSTAPVPITPVRTDSATAEMGMEAPSMVPPALPPHGAPVPGSADIGVQVAPHLLHTLGAGR